MKRSAFPIRVELETIDGFGKWNVMLTYVVNDISVLYKKIETIKTMYVLDKKEYRIFFYMQSKVNTYLE
jgi:hypothetical protein